MYALLEKIIDYIGAADKIPISPRNITKIFVSSDVVTFLVQCSGGSLQTSNSESVRQTASNTVLGGLGIQVAFFLFFIYMTLMLDKRTSDQQVEKG